MTVGASTPVAEGTKTVPRTWRQFFDPKRVRAAAAGSMMAPWSFELSFVLFLFAGRFKLDPRFAWVPVDLTLFWVPEGGMISDVQHVSYARLKSVPGAEKGMATWRFYE